MNDYFGLNQLSFTDPNYGSIQNSNTGNISSFNTPNTMGSSLATSSLDTTRDLYNQTLQQGLDDKNSMWGQGGKFDTFAGNAGKLLGGVSSLANIYLGFKNLGMAEDALDIKKDQWAESKKELQHMQATRKKISNEYKTGSSMAR